MNGLFRFLMLAVLLPFPVAQAQPTNVKGKTLDKQMRICSEAVYNLQQCDVARLDRDNDGIPCESICGKTKSAMQKKLEQGR